MSTLAVFIALGGTSIAATGVGQDRQALNKRVALGLQQADGPNPGSGVVEVRDAPGKRVTQLTHYQYGSTLRSTGDRSHLFEFFLGDDGFPPSLSVRGVKDGLGAKIEARDGMDYTGLVLNYEKELRPTLTISDQLGVHPGSTLGIDNPEPSGGIELTTKNALGYASTVRVTSSGDLVVPGGLSVGGRSGGPVLFHGAQASGMPADDPGPLAPADLQAIAPGRLGDVLHEQAVLIAAMRRTLLNHGLLAGSSAR